MVPNLGSSTDLALINQSLLSLAWLILLAACSSATQSEADDTLAQAREIYAEAIEIHDEVMPRMDELMQLRQQLQARVDSLRQVDSVAYSDTLVRMQAAIESLEQADEGMMQWMRSVEKVAGIDEPTSEYQEEITATQLEDTTDIMRIQQEQKEAIVEVKRQMESSISTARNLLGTSE